MKEKAQMKVKYSYLKEQFADSEEIFKALRDQLTRCQFTFGSELKEFEDKFAHLCQARYALGVGTGTDALMLALKALSIGQGDEVITAPNSFIATAGAIVAAGARLVFVDVNNEYNMNISLIEDAITHRTKAILPVHLTGNPADMPAIIEIARKYKLFIVEDACQAINATINGKPTGSFGDAGCFSLHPLKNLNVWGDGGVLITQSYKLYEKVCLLRNHGLKNRDEVEFLGYNSRLDTIQAIVANHVLNKIEEITQRRIHNACIYDQGLSKLDEQVIIPPRRKNVRQVFHLYVIQVQKRSELMQYLAKNGIETKVHYPIPIHLQKGCQFLGYKKGDFPVCEAQAESILSLPVHQHLEESEIDYVIDHIRSFYEEK